MNGFKCKTGVFVRETLSEENYNDIGAKKEPYINKICGYSFLVPLKHEILNLWERFKVAVKFIDEL